MFYWSYAVCLERGKAAGDDGVCGEHQRSCSGHDDTTDAAGRRSYPVLRAGVQPTLDPYAEAFYSTPIALTLGGEEFSVNDVCKCVRDCKVGWAE